MKSLRLPLLIALAFLTFFSSLAWADVALPQTFVMDYQLLEYPTSLIVGLALSAAMIAAFFCFRKFGAGRWVAVALCVVFYLAANFGLYTYAKSERDKHRRGPPPRPDQQISLNDGNALVGEEAIFPAGAKLKPETENGAGGEGPAWHPKLGVLTSGNGHIMQLDLEGKSKIYRKDAGTNGLLFDVKGRLLACEPRLRRVTRTELDGTITVLTEKFEGKRYNQPNDITVDSQGRIYFSDPRYGNRNDMQIRDEKGQTIEGVYRIDPDGKVTRVIGREVDRANGVLVSPDDRFLYVADNNNDSVKGARKLWRFELRKDGTVDLANPKLLYDWGKGRGPDGLKQDQKGRLYVAAGLNKPNPPFEQAEDKKGGIYVFSPEGQLLTFLAVPRDEVTNCAFGGDDLKTLYITGGGTLYSIRTTTPGRVVFPTSK